MRRGARQSGASLNAHTKHRCTRRRDDDDARARHGRSRGTKRARTTRGTSRAGAGGVGARGSGRRGVEPRRGGARGDDDDDDDDDDDVSRMPGGGRRTGGESLVREHADVRVVGVRGRVRRGGARRERVRDDARTTGARRGAGSAEDSGFMRRVRENETNFGRCVGASWRGDARRGARRGTRCVRASSRPRRELSATTSRFLRTRRRKYRLCVYSKHVYGCVTKMLNAAAGRSCSRQLKVS